MPRTKSVFFGPSPDESYDNGVRPCVAINAHNVVIEIHEGTTTSSLNARVAGIKGVELMFQPKPDTPKFTSGYYPAVAINNRNVVVEIHGSGTTNRGYLFYSVGTVDTAKGTVSFADAVQIGDQHAFDPSIALNEAGDLVEVHNSSSEQSSALYYRRGNLRGTTVTWPKEALDLKGFPNDRRTIGNSPAVAMNNKGQIIAVYENGGNLYYLRGDLQSSGVRWRQPRPYQDGVATKGREPSITLTDDGVLLEVHTVAENKLFLRVGRLDLDPDAIIWQDWLEPGTFNYSFDTGRRVQIACNGKVAVQVHQSQAYREVYANASLSFDRADWLSDNRDRLAQRTLKELAMPGSHDAGAYLTGGPGNDAAQTQDLTIFGQLSAGVRYFDLRPAYSGGKPFDRNKLFTWHDPIFGPQFTTVLKDVHDFMLEHNELVILKISHYNSHFDQDIFDGMIKLIKDDPDIGLGRWLFTDDGTKRLADRPLADYLREDRGTVLVLVDSNGSHNPDNKPPDVDYLAASRPRPSGFFGYRDWYATDPQAGDLTVFDVYSNIANFDKMVLGEDADPDRARAVLRNGTPLRRGQLHKNNWFDGICRNQYDDRGVKKDWPCDLFLLSWTLTPFGGGAFDTSREASQRLATFMAATPDKNPQGRSINILYTDAVEYSRSVDVAFIRNGLDLVGP